MNILVLSAAYKSYATQSIVKAGRKRGHIMTVLDPAYLYLLINESVNGYDAVYDGYNRETPERIKAKEIDAIIPRIGVNLSYAAAVLEHLNRNLNIFSTQRADGIKIAADKLISMQRLSQAGVRCPKTILGDKAIHPAFMMSRVEGLPAISKGLTGSQGKTVYPLNDEYQTNVFLENFHHRKEHLLLQKMIDAGGRDIRVIVIDGEVVAAMERTAKKGELRSNLSQGGSGRKIELSEADKEMCIKAANACGLKCAGVDIMKDKNGTSYCIEVNGNYGYKAEKLTGIDLSTPLIQYCERNYRKGGRTDDKNKTFVDAAEPVGKKPEPKSETQKAIDNKFDFFNRLRNLTN